MRIENGFQMRRSGFFFAVPHKSDIRAQRNPAGSKRVEGRQLGEDGGFVVSRAARPDSRFTVETFHKRLEWRGNGPFRRSDRLAVIVSIEDDGAFRARHIDFSVND